MKKLSVVLLAILLIFGLALQAAAELATGLDETAFEGDYKIIFGNPDVDEVTIANCDPISNQYGDYGVTFEGLFGASDLWSGLYGFDSYSAANFDPCSIYSTNSAPPITAIFDPPVIRVGFNGRSYYGEIIVKVFSGDVVTELGPIPASTKTFIGIGDTAGIDKIEISGTGQVLTVEGAFYIDDFQFGGTPDTGPTEPEVKTVVIEIKPPNCLDARIPINPKSQGVTPVVIAGSADLDVTMIDLDSIELNGVPPVRSAIGDVPTCNSEEPDVYSDLTLKFNTHDLVEAMEVSPADREAVENGEWPRKGLKLKGNLLEESGGTAIEGETSVTLVGKLKPEKANNGKGSHQGHDRGHHHGWHKSHGQHKHKGWDKN